MNILITSLGNKANLCRYFRRALFNEGGGRLFGMDNNPIANGREFVDEFFTSPKLNDENFIDWFCEKISRFEIDLIVPSRDEDVAFLATNIKKILRAKSVRVLVPSLQVVKICQDKNMFGIWCLENGFSVPPLVSLSEDNPNFPLIAKPREGAGSKGVHKISNLSEWLLLRSELDDRYLVQEFIDAPEFTVDLFVDSNGEIKTVVPRRRVAVDHGESIRAEIDLDAKIIEECSKIALGLSLVGHNTIQCFKAESGQIVFCEINLRYGGGFPLGVEAGADTPRYLVRELKGLDIKFELSDLNPKLKMVRVQKDLFYQSDDLSESKDFKPKIFCFDLDGTICTEHCRYEDAQVMPHIVEKINRLYDSGHTIIISTARGAASGTCWRALIESQLAEWGIRYHKLHTDKPYADVYIDNKALDILDFI